MTLPGYFADMFSDAGMRDVFSDSNRCTQWLRTEVALAVAQEEEGIIPTGTSDRIKKAAEMSNINQAEMKAEFDKVGFPILPFVHQLTKACDPETARWVHYGATTQDILDTGTVLQMKQGLGLIEIKLNQITSALAELTEEHRNTAMAGRTFQQIAAPITFGFKTAVWLDEVIRHRERIQALKSRVLVGQCSGAVGTFATLGNKGLKVQARMMKELELGVPDISWHTARDRWAELICVFAMLGATLAKIAQEIVVLMRSEVGELSEPFEKGRGASTTLPQKRNPVYCEPVLAGAHRLRELAGSQMISMVQEHERGGLGQMHLEWLVVPDAFLTLSGALKHSTFVLENLVVDQKKMFANLQLSGGLMMSEAVMMALAPKIGKQSAHELVSTLTAQSWESGTDLKSLLLADTSITSLLTHDEINEALNPLNYIGVASQMSDIVLAKAKTVNRTGAGLDSTD